MSSQLFDAQLLIPDSNASHQQLFDLITAGKFTGRGLPDVARKYLDAFCNKSYSDGRRRWVGIALVGMMRASSSVVQRLKKLSGLTRIGAIVLDHDSTEERRIIAGLIIRQGLEMGIDFADFWKSSKVRDSAPNFPRDVSDHWMSRFQTYLDTLSDLALTNMNTGAAVLYPISLSTKDGFQRAGRSLLALVEKNLLTMVVPDASLTEFHFIDIPLGHITGTSLHEDSPHQSQAGRSGHKMYNLIVDLRRISPNYHLDTSDRTTCEFKVSFQAQDDAREFQAGLANACNCLGTTAGMGAKTFEDTGLSHKENIAGQKHRGPLGLLEDTALTKQERSRGKLPSISKATKEKAVRSQHQPSGSSKVTKARAAKTAAPIIDASEDENEGEDSSQDEYNLKSTAQMQTSVSSGTARKSQNRRKASAADEDFVPSGQKAKSTSTKRKRASSDAAERSQTKKRKSQTKTNAAPGVSAASKISKKQTAPAQESVQADPDRIRKPMMQSSAHQNIQNGVSTRHALIGGLVKSKSPSQATAPTFKKPGQPASTPGKPRSKPARATPKTPHATHRDLDGFPIGRHSSTPRSQSIHEEDFGLGYTPLDNEILSSNTKRVPDSPHAESTAISGHADQEVVRREKCKGDLETAKSDPFQQRRVGQTITTFTRKLTGEGFVECGTRPGDRPSMQVNLLNEDIENDELAAISASQPLPKQSPSLFKHRTHSNNPLRGPNSLVQNIDLGGLPTPATRSDKNSTAMLSDASRLLHNEAAKSPRPNETYTQRQTVYLEQSSPAPRREWCHTGMPAENTVHAQDSVVSGPQETIEDTLLEASVQADLIEPDGETTLTGDEVDLPAQQTIKESELRFRSSPPIPDSSSIRDNSDESEPEPEPSPPTSRADELEWEQALQPHQRNLHEQLLRTSKRIMRHIVDNETAVTDIADRFTGDAEHLLSLTLEKQNNQSSEAFRDLSSKKQDMLRELSDTSRRLTQQRRQLRADK